MSQKFLLLFIIVALSASINSTSCGQNSSSNGKPVAKKVVTTPSAKPEKETRGEVKYEDFELTWPSIDTHQRSMLTVSGKDVKWTQRFVDGDPPVFNPIEEGIEAGQYTFRVQYTGNEVGKAEEERKAAFKNRRDLLKKRLELLRKGDREGSKAALDQANKIRSEQMAKPKPDVSELRNGKKSDFISRTGKFVIVDGGKIQAYDEKKEHESLAGRAKNRIEETEEESSHSEY